MKFKMKLNEVGYKSLKDELIKNENYGPFSKTPDIMLALDLLAKGETNSNQVTKAHLYNIIKVLCTHLEWNEEETEEKITKSDITENQDESSSLSNANVLSNNSQESKNSQEICKFYKSSNCKHGRSGKKLDSNGKAYAFSHPPLCKKFEMHGYKKERCKNRKCDKLHLNLCKIYMRHYSCKFGAM